MAPQQKLECARILSADCHYAVLGVRDDATRIVIDAAFKKLSLVTHPDKGGDADAFRRLKDAHEVVSNHSSRQRYDREKEAAKNEMKRKEAAKNEHLRYQLREMKRKEAAKNEQLREMKRKEAAKNAQLRETKRKGEVEKFRCSVCKEICQDVHESFCGKCLMCKTCSKGKKHANCKVCKNAPKSQRFKPAGRWLCAQIDALAPKCACGRNVLPEEKIAHEKVCPKLNHACFRCKGKGTVRVKGKRKTECSACRGTKVLPGLSWTGCKMCKEWGSYDTIKGRRATCKVCNGVGAVKGSWWACKQCNNNAGWWGEDTGEKGKCRGCDGKGMSNYATWTECVICDGHGGFQSHFGYNGPVTHGCLSCAGTGRLPAGKWEKCAVCKKFNKFGCKKCDYKMVVRLFIIE
jgi:DnaJ family protein A protein 2